ncbi:MAG: MBL fold metallo-hydrolase [Proteobacteria bacterium]|nr:MBL fold metallo-hydrolase [Pseudomonadota bacterium]
MNHCSRRQMLLGLAGGATLLAATGKAAESSIGPKLLLLGTQGGPNFNATRGETASAVLLDGRIFMVDCGYGALGALVRANLNYRDVDHVFLTHLHDDHAADLVALLGHQWTGGRVTPTTVHGPAGTRRLVDAAIRYNQVNEEIRLVDEARSVRVASMFRSHEVSATNQPTQVLRAGDLTVRAVQNTHYPAATLRRVSHRSLALRFDARGRSVVFSGDTAYSPALVELARGADMLVCEAMHVAATRRGFDERVAAGAYADNPEGIWQHIVDTHTPLDVAGRMAREAGVGTLVLNHIIPGGWNPELDDEFYRREVAREFAGRIIVGRDGMLIEDLK